MPAASATRAMPRTSATVRSADSSTRGSSSSIAAARYSRASLYRTLSPKGNPRLSTLLAVIKAAGFRLSLDGRKRRVA